MITYTLDITSLHSTIVDGQLEKVVASAAWMLTAVDDSVPPNRVTVRGTNTFDPPNSASFVPYEQLTELTVKDWIYASGGYLAVKEYADVKVAELQAAATKTLPLPWV